MKDWSVKKLYQTIPNNLIKFAEKYNIVAEQIDDNTFKLYTKNFMCDSWLAIFEEDMLELKHLNKCGQKMNYHVQKRLPKNKWKKIFRIITQHNNYRINKKYMFEMDKIDKKLREYERNFNERNKRKI